MSIPRTLHTVYLTGELPDHLAANVEQWRELHPRWRHVHWRLEDLRWLKNQDLFDSAEDFKLSPHATAQYRSDIARYEILWTHGGLYVDVDTVPLRPVDDALHGLSAFAAAEDATWIGNTYLASVPTHSVMRALIARLPGNVANRYKGWRANRLSGPRYLTPIWRDFHCHVAPRELWFPYSYADVKAGTVPSSFPPEVYAVHQWEHTRSQLTAR